MRCRNCGADLPADARFCSECGAPQQAAAGAPAGAGAPPSLAQPGQDEPAWRPVPAGTPAPNPWAVDQSVREYESYRRFGAAQRSFTTPAIITLLLYLVLWLPGLIANIVYLNEAKNVERITGRPPEGKGCLVAMLWVFILVPVAACVLFGGLGMLGSLADGGS